MHHYNVLHVEVLQEVDLGVLALEILTHRLVGRASVLETGVFKEFFR
jgi:hypothetical protein